ncbi:molybdopterin molybdotransferase MoeA [Thalassomonas sp. M1454]|uniref:molybdopterin molybdotransferase MoeA n=1 Tax=Thalassomonas sp. M1454 TaxID=2594477 RepID=UPI00117DBDF4|nr:molybdopterin molybdotransferase MoeA [Thalassomonas sp. M1454]TRX53813.1 molybdopterin molybdotransferase MoeA [Thalassomonas sp. M1454]
MSDCCSAPGLMPFNTALKQLLDNVPSATKTQMLAIEDCLDRVLAADVVSPVNVPPHNNSAMDGYAFHSSSLSLGGEQTMQVVGRSFAGEPYSGKTNVGECIRIMTGAKLPECCDTVVMQENTSVDNNTMALVKAPKAQANVRYCGEDISKNEAVFSKGHKLSAIDLGMLASLGIADVEVFAPITVAVLSTGDELKSPGQTLSDGDIFESNRFALLGLLARLNVNVLDLGIIADDKQAIRDAFIKADLEADVVISSGGVSVGEADYTKDILDELGSINFWKIAMKPGKPFAFGKLPNSVFFGLPGNPVSALVTFYKLSVPGIEKMQGQPYKANTQFSAITTTPLRKSPGRMDFQRALLSYNEQGLAQVTSTGSQGSGVLSSIGRANCFIVLSAEQGSVEAGESVIVEPFTSVFQ